ncbi:MAG: hypothetical protein HC878_00320 [Leptolyngbyaceae cyanobacterium SL_5_14]|nr:hypothetical protein [Leptolyngbyaceae cyanobacterium SL_5_14]
MSDKLVDRMIKLQTGLGQLHTNFGEQQYRPTIIKKVTNSVIPLDRYHLMVPNPRIDNVPQRLLGLEIAENIYIKATDIQISEVPRSEPEQWFTEDVEYYVIDPEFNHLGELALDDKDNAIQKYQQFYKPLFINTKDVVTFTIILRKLKDHYRASAR